jgi:hypothetical protein
MTATQTKLRRGTAAQIAAMTPVEAEVVVNTTDERIHIGDGTTPGGFGCPNLRDIQQQKAIVATVGGTATAITLTNTPAVLSYAAPLTLRFKATATNTGAATVNVDGLGVKNIYKMFAGSLTALVGYEIVSGAVCEITYDGTQFVLGYPQNGSVGEYLSSTVTSGSAVALTSGAVTDVTSLALTPGSWNLFGLIGFGGSSTAMVYARGGASTASVTLPTQGTYSGMQLTSVVSSDAQFALPTLVLNIASPTTYYLVAQSSFSSGTVNAYGFIGARRV